MRQISILGCGWLGLPLAKELAKKYSIKGSVTTPEKLILLEAEGIKPYRIDLDSPDGNAVADFLQGSDTLIIAIPQKARTGSNISYADKLNGLLQYIIKAGIRQVLFTSSISVYRDSESVQDVDEATIPNPETESGKQVLAAEQIARDCPEFKTTIVRLGGLIGGERHPIYHLAGRQNLENAAGPVNLIHRDQCIDIITRIIDKNIWGEIFTAVHPLHKSRKEYYTEKALEFNLLLPHFTDTGTVKGKIVKGQEKLMQVLGFHFPV